MLLVLLCCSEEAVRKSASVSAAKSSKAGGTAPVDLDPSGSQYLALEPLAAATPFVQLLQTHAPHSAQTWRLSLQLARRANKWLLAWRALLRVESLQRDDPDAHFELMALLLLVQRGWDGSSAVVRQALQDEWSDSGRQGDVQRADVAALNQSFLQQHTHSVPHRLAGQTQPHTHTHTRPQRPIVCWL